MSRGQLRDLVALTKPRITVMVIFTALAGLWLAPVGKGPFRACVFLFGLMLLIGGANALNMYIERESDGRMRRTRTRPLPAGRMAPAIALWFGVILGILSVPFLFFGGGAVAALLGALSFVIYVLVYTPMKQRSPVALSIGAIPGAMPPLMGWSAATGGLEAPGLVLFFLLFFWQVPHFLAITLYRKDEMVAAGYKVIAAQQGEWAAKTRIVLYAALLLPVSLLLRQIGGTVYLVFAGLAGVAFFGWSLFGLREGAGVRWARSFFNLSLVYVMVVAGALCAGRLLK